MNYSELTKLYPKFKIPVSDHADYYIQTLIFANEVKKETLEDFYDLNAKVEIGKYKMRLLKSILTHFENNDWKLNNLLFPSPLFDRDGYSELEFNNYNPSYYYVSIDLKEANWQAFKKTFNLKLPLWEEWVTKEFDMHPFIAKSKSFRQLVFGNTHPKRLQNIQQVMMKEIVSSLPSMFRDTIVSRKSDELILELPNFSGADLLELSKFDSDCVSVNVFQMKNVESANENVKLKTDLEGKVKMVNVPGHRYFFHLKNVILKETIDERDLYFELDHKLAKWVI